MKTNPKFARLVQAALLFVAAGFFCAPSARAEEITRASYWPTRDDIYVSDFTTYYGPNVGNINSYTVDGKGNPTHSPMLLDNEMTFAYLIDRAGLIGFGPSIRFNYTPVLGKGFDWNDVGLKVIDYHAIHTANLNVAWNFYFIFPTAVWLKEAGMSYALKSTPSISWDIPDTNFTIGSWTEIKAYLGVNYGTQLKLMYQPYIKYKLNKHFALNLLYEEEMHHDVNMHGPAFGSFKNYRNDIQPGFVWSINHAVQINPYLQVFINNKITPDTMALGAVMNARIL